MKLAVRVPTMPPAVRTTSSAAPRMAAGVATHASAVAACHTAVAQDWPPSAAVGVLSAVRKARPTTVTALTSVAPVFWGHEKLTAGAVQR